MNDKKEDPEIMAPEASHSEGPHLDKAITEDAVFGTITSEGPNYRNVHLGTLLSSQPAPRLT